MYKYIILIFLNSIVLAGEQVFVRAITDKPSTLIPFMSISEVDFSIIKYIYDRLFNYDDNLGITSNVLENWFTTDNKTLKLKPDWNRIY